MDELGVASCDLVGTSRGGGVAMMMAALAPERVRRLILVDPINPWSARGKLLSVCLSNRLVAPLFVTLAPHFRMVQEYYFRRLFGDTRRIRPGTAEGYAKPLQLPGAFGYAISVLKTWNQDLRELESLLPRIAHIPTLLVWGSLDAAVNPASALILKKYFRNCRLVMMDGIGHLPYEEAPEEFSRAVSEFLQGDRAH
jgi:pimeloyl-ACP methyl ester carboxylesterase